MANTPRKLEHARTWPHGIQRIALLIPSYRRPCPCRCSATGGIDHSVFIRRADRLVAGGVMAGDPRFLRRIFIEFMLGSRFLLFSPPCAEFPAPPFPPHCFMDCSAHQF